MNAFPRGGRALLCGRHEELERRPYASATASQQLRRRGESVTILTLRDRSIQPAFAKLPQKVKVSSSATKKMRGPPVEIDTAWANVSFAPSEAAQAFKTSIDGK